MAPMIIIRILIQSVGKLRLTWKGTQTNQSHEKKIIERNEIIARSWNQIKRKY